MHLGDDRGNDLCDVVIMMWCLLWQLFTLLLLLLVLWIVTWLRKSVLERLRFWKSHISDVAVSGFTVCTLFDLHGVLQISQGFFNGASELGGMRTSFLKIGQ